MCSLLKEKGMSQKSEPDGSRADKFFWDVGQIEIVKWPPDPEATPGNEGENSSDDIEPRPVSRL
jgi:hypothetical protein